MELHEAVEKGDIEAVKQHLAAGADVNTKDDNGMTPLHLAVGSPSMGTAKVTSSCALKVTELLLTKGANVNSKDRWEQTPLHYAAHTGLKEIAELLITEGADVNAKDDDGMTPLDGAISFDETELADLLRKHGGKTKKELEAAGK